MKKVVNIVSVLTLALCLCFSLSSCFFLAYRTNATVSDAEMSAVTIPDKEYVIPAGYKSYNYEDISLAYPENWSITNSSVVLIVNETGAGNNITLAYEPFSNVYTDITAQEFEEMVKSSYEAAGASMSGTSVKQTENQRGLAITQITYKMIMSGVTMDQTMFIFPAGNRNYIVTVTETDKDSELVETVFESLWAVK